MERIAIYLRKSRADLEAEARGEGETLTKHRRQLISVANQMKLQVIQIFEEVVSGERIMDRPEAMKLLRAVEDQLFDAVLVMDIDRLGRGDMIDQGTILRAFKTSKTKIITPNKVYDLDNEWDEEYTEFEAFMARRELKVITRRMQRGRVQSVKDGNYIGAHPPYGYVIHKTEKERALVPHPDQAPIVKLIYDWYTHDDPRVRMGGNRIANELNRLGHTSYTGRRWTSSAVLNIIKNAVYIGRIQWKKRETVKATEPGVAYETRTRPREEWIDVEGKHAPLISVEQYQKAQNILKRRYHVPYQVTNRLTNPLAGLIKCGLCNGAMVLRAYTRQQPHLICYNTQCPTKSSRFTYVEQRLIHALTDWLRDYKADWTTWIEHHQQNDPNQTFKIKEKALRTLERELDEVNNQKNRLHDLLEKGIYDEPTYLERAKQLTKRIENTNAAIAEAKKDLQAEKQRLKVKKDFIPNFEQILALYNHSDDPADKNNLLKSVLNYAIYTKEKEQSNDHFTLVLYPKIPQ
ncbi:serine recombinase [Ammoniphilus oxalaticus]|uniref:Serine recombinase n=1 Tax=Ammoniphilus oxalaticus TaxID=66863 RepID=A0A419SJ20_9BACL|nr:recombinase family protein [Ammoniphilus oxalaticus]RKD23950.1 serine recombinase [Ammoniphilus oxalaticus]